MQDTKKIFLLDRDATLISKPHTMRVDNRLMNDKMIPLLQQIIASHKWAIVSTGATSKNDDPGLRAIRNHGLDYSKNPPGYPLLGSGNHSTIDVEKLLGDSLEKLEDKAWVNEDKILNEKKVFLYKCIG